MPVQHRVLYSLSLSVYELLQPRASCQRQRAAKTVHRRGGREARGEKGVQPADNFPCKSKIGFARASVVGPASQCVQTSADNSPQTLGVLRVYRYKNIRTNQICRWQPLTVCHLQPFAPSLRSSTALGPCLCCCLCLFLYPLNAFCAHFEIVAHLHFWFDLVVVFFSPPASSPIQLCFDFVLPWADSFIFLYFFGLSVSGKSMEIWLKSRLDLAKVHSKHLPEFAKSIYICKYMCLFVFQLCWHLFEVLTNGRTLKLNWQS